MNKLILSCATAAAALLPLSIVPARAQYYVDCSPRAHRANYGCRSQAGYPRLPGGYAPYGGYPPAYGGYAPAYPDEAPVIEGYAGPGYVPFYHSHRANYGYGYGYGYGGY